MSILFSSDWGKYPNACIHYETKNQSFLKLANIYHGLGVKNCAFHLALLQPELKNIDPFDENLPIDIKSKVIYECKNNFWYFLREIARVPVPGSLVPTQFQANRANIALYWFFFNHITVLIVILRQTGKTTMLMMLVVYLLNFGTTNAFINLLTKSEGLKAETLKKVKDLFDELPDYLNFSTKKDIFNSDLIKLNAFDNQFKGNLSSSSPKQAEKVGRGFTSPINIIDEGAFIENIAIAMGAMLMSGNAARTAAKLNNKPYGTVIATTAGNIDDRDGNYIYKLATAATVLDELFFDCKDNDDLVETIYKNSNASKNEAKRPIINITLSYRQLGYSDEWLKEKLAENISTPENIKRDIFNQWLSGSSSSPIPKQYIETMRANVVELPRSQFYSPYNYLLKWYISENEVQYRIQNGRSFIVGIDTSDGVGRDDITFIVRDHSNGEVICTAIFNEINLITLADFFVSFLLTYTNSVMIIERRSSAATIIDYIIQKLLQHEINPFTRLYNTIFQNKEQYPKEFEEISKARYYNEDVFIKYKKHIGFVTSGSGITSRAELYSTTLMAMLKYTGYCLYDDTLVTQISSLIIKNNRIDHPEGGNDDMVISSLLSYWLLTSGKNLSLYGIDTYNILKSNRVYLDEKYSSSTSDYDEEEAIELERRFNTLLEEYKSENNPVIAKQIEIKIKKIASEIDFTGNKIISVEEMLDSINRDRRIRRSYG